MGAFTLMEIFQDELIARSNADRRRTWGVTAFRTTVSRSDFIVYCLRQQGLLPDSVLDVVLANFDKLDVTRDGSLDQEDLQNKRLVRRKSYTPPPWAGMEGNARDSCSGCKVG